ncbi:MAG: hypothetical protein LKK00_02090 [Intestinimonas sp.]|jgi:hypothetical protein|nr:hypothetical protein [Intestinimonas sp.]
MAYTQDSAARLTVKKPADGCAANETISETSDTVYPHPARLIGMLGMRPLVDGDIRKTIFTINQEKNA